MGLGCRIHEAAPHPSLQSGAVLQLAQIAAAGNAAEKWLLADVTAKYVDASYTDLLYLFKARRRVSMGTPKLAQLLPSSRSVASGICWLHRACCAFARAHLLAAAARDLTLGHTRTALSAQRTSAPGLRGESSRICTVTLFRLQLRVDCAWTALARARSHMQRGTRAIRNATAVCAHTQWFLSGDETADNAAAACAPFQR
jgi:hypothetical protein